MVHCQTETKIKNAHKPISTLNTVSSDGEYIALTHKPRPVFVVDSTTSANIIRYGDILQTLGENENNGLYTRDCHYYTLQGIK